MRAVGIRVGKDAHLPVAKAGEVAAARLDPDGDRDVVNLLRGEDLARRELPSVQDLAPKRHHRLELPVAGLFGRAARGVALHEKELRSLRILRNAVGELSGQGRARRRLLADHRPRGADARLGPRDHVLGEAVAGIGVLAQPQAQLVLHHPGHERGAFARREAVLGLAGELRFRHLDREHVLAGLPDVLRGELHAARKEAPELAVLAQSLGEPGAKAVHVGPALGSRDQVDVALRDGARLPAAARQRPRHRPVRRLRVPFETARERPGGQDLRPVEGGPEVLAEALVKAPLVALAGLLPPEGDPEAGAEHRLRPQQVA